MNYVNKRKNIDEKLISQLCGETCYDKNLVEVLAMRGIDTAERIEKFCSVDTDDLSNPLLYGGIKEAKERLLTAIDNNESIVVYGDYDCDGICATAMLILFLRSKGIDAKYYIPNRETDGYGINKAALEYIAENVYPDLLITVDCGISSKDEVRYAEEVLGIEVIVTDHHEPPSDLPECVAVNPKVSSNGAFVELCGAGVALKLIESIAGRDAALVYADIAAIATVADVVPLFADNRILVSEGLKLINSAPRKGIEILKSKIGRLEKYLSSDIAYRIAPRINAVGRLDDANKVVELFLSDDAFELTALVADIESANEKRQKICEEIFQSAMRKLIDYNVCDKKIIVLSGDDWNAGVIGVVCAKLAETFNRPTVLLAKSGDYYKGSCRSVDGVNIYEKLRDAAHLLTKFGGHSGACGLTLRADNLEKFSSFIIDGMRNESEEFFLPSAVYDIDVTDKISCELINALTPAEPHGAGNEQVACIYRGALSNWSRINGTNHIKQITSDDNELVAFHMGDKMNYFNNKGEKTYFLTMDNKVFRNRLYAQGIIRGYSTDTIDFSDEYLAAAKQAYRISCGEQSIFSPKRITLEESARLTGDGIYGTLYICSLAETYRDFIKVSESIGCKIIRVSDQFLADGNCYNQIVYDMNVTENLVYYKNVVFLDKPIKLGLIDDLYLNANAKVYYVKDKLKQTVLQNVPDYDKMVKIYLRIATVLKCEKAFTLSDVRAHIETDVNTIELYIALYTLLDLEIIKKNASGALAIDGRVSTSLKSSVYYTNLCRLRDEAENDR